MSDLRQIVADVLGVPAEQIRDSRGPEQFPQWDSAAHIEIILACEGEYGVTFTPEEMVAMFSFGGLREVLRKKGAAAG